VSPTNKAENVLFTIPALADAVRKENYQKLSTTTPADWQAWLFRSMLLCWHDRPAEAVDAACTAFTLCPMTEESLQTCANALARTVLIATRDFALAQRLVDYLLYGANGPDGKAGTADDIIDPFPEVRRRLTYAEPATMPTPKATTAK